MNFSFIIIRHGASLCQYIDFDFWKNTYKDWLRVKKKI